MMDVDAALSRLGTVGRWQITSWTLLGISSYMALAINMLVIVFTGQSFEHWCKSPQSNVTSTDGGIHNVFLNVTNIEDRSSCSVTSFNYTNMTSDCVDGWQYSLPDGASSIVNEFDLVCSSSYMKDMSQTVFTVGLCISDIFVSSLSDRFGRKLVHLVCGTLLAAVNIALAFSPNIITFIVLRFFCGIFVDGCFSSGFVLANEHFPHHSRDKAISYMALFWIVGELLLTFLSSVLPNWRHLQIAISSIGLIFIMYFWIIDESVPWLAVNGREQKAKQILVKAAKLNKLQDPKWDLNATEQISSMKTSDISSSPGQRRETIYDVIRHRSLCIQLIIICVMWAINNVVYYGITLGIGNIAGDLHFNMYILTGTDLISNVLVVILNKRWGYNISICGGHMIAGVCLIAVAFIPLRTDNGADLSMLITSVVMVGKVAISTSFCSVCLFTPEAFPTQTRNVTYGIAMITGRFGAMVAPFYSYLMTQEPILPPLVCGAASVIVGIAALYLPKTKGRPLFQTIAEMETWTQHMSV